MLVTRQEGEEIQVVTLKFLNQKGIAVVPGRNSNLCARRTVKGSAWFDVRGSTQFLAPSPLLSYCPISLGSAANVVDVFHCFPRTPYTVTPYSLNSTLASQIKTPSKVLMNLAFLFNKNTSSPSLQYLTLLTTLT